MGAGWPSRPGLFSRSDSKVGNIHPAWLVWQGDQGFLPVDEVKRQVETFGKHLLPRYK